MKGDLGTRTEATAALGHAVREWGSALAVLLMVYFSFDEAIRHSFESMVQRPEYGHGLIIPFIAGFLVWQRRAALSELPLTGSWAGVIVLLFAVMLNAAGRLSSLFILQQYAAVLTIYGIVLSLVGWAIVKRLWAPLLILVFMIPLPGFLYNNLSASLQLVSSAVGVWFVRLFGISVYLEGNVIDLGVYQLQVAEACDGLRYLFPLMTIGFIVAYMFEAPFWKRAIVFASTVPITILMNSFRIGTIGVMVEHWGIEMAEGFLHEFQGWAVFMVSIALLLMEVGALARLGPHKSNLRDALSLNMPDPVTTRRAQVRQRMPSSSVAGLAILGLATIWFQLGVRSVNVVPNRVEFSRFPMTVGSWVGRREPLDRVYQDVLLLDDYLLANYSRPGSRPINLYVAWYNSQEAGRSAHSPRSCLPAGGWQIQSFTQRYLKGISVNGEPLQVNRALIQLGDQRLLVYYWFQQRGRVVTNEYTTKWFLFWDSLVRNRTDGALVRLTIPLSSTEQEADIEAELIEFASTAARAIPAYVPS